MSDSSLANLVTRILVAAIAIPVILWTAWEGGYLFFGFVALVSAFSLSEFYGLAERKGMFPLKTIGIAAGFIVNAAFIYERLQGDIFRILADRGILLPMFSQLQFLLVVELVFILLVLLVELFRDKGSPVLNLGATVLGVLFISLFFGTLIATRELFPFGFPVYKFFPVAFAGEGQSQTIARWGGFTLISIFATIWVCDTAAYFVGRSIGWHRLFERVSPKKSWEGAIAGFVFALGTMLAARSLVLDYLSVTDALALGGIVGFFGQLGDLVESRFKRDAGVKDSSSIIPGHGGVFDRFDSLVFAAPIVYLYIDFVVLS